MLRWLASEFKAATAADEAARFALDLSDRQVSLIERSGGRERVRGVAPHDAADFGAELAKLRRMVSRGDRAPVDLLLPDELTLFRVETFPAEARRNVREEVWWRLDTLTPYRPEELCYDVVVVGVEPNTGFLDVHIAVAPKEIVDEAVVYARAWGFDPQRVTSRERAFGFPNGPLFLQASSGLTNARPLRRAAGALAAAALALAVVGAARGAWERHALAETLDAQRLEAEAALNDALALRERTLSLADRAMRPTARRKGQRLTLDWLQALASALPPEAVAQRIVIGDGALRIEGVADNAEAVLAALNVAEEFTTVRYAEPVRETGRRPAHRFAIEAALTAKGQDE